MEVEMIIRLTPPFVSVPLWRTKIAGEAQIYAMVVGSLICLSRSPSMGRSLAEQHLATMKIWGSQMVSLSWNGWSRKYNFRFINNTIIVIIYGKRKEILGD
ncbi:unnamed protein product [Lactuca saligna]|uniref:Uncharacterized protein n=1 Tax=Lactuca saligna TaxID=75948 RepID=A0AA35V468_LACSI|nr:unnamed protein product [Lactuca saligna]